MIEIDVIHPGLLTTIQDDGRRGVSFFGIPRAGHMDPGAAHEANAIVGNDANAPLVECNLLPPQLHFNHDTVVGVAGADMRWTVDDEPLARGVATRVAAGSVLTGSYAVDGARSYIAFGGTIECRRDYDSASTYTYAGLGGIDGRALAKGDVIRVSPGHAATRVMSSGPRHLYGDGPRVPFVRGPEWGLLTSEAQKTFTSANYAISANSNRMGARLEGPALVMTSNIEMETVPLLPGTVQLPASGQPIVILADGQTTGGYPRVAVIPSAGLAVLNQVRPGETFRFRR